MSKPLEPKWVVIGAPSSAGAYAPGQEKAPQALRAAGLLESLKARRITVEDWGDVPGFRWRVDHTAPRAMNVMMASTVARATAERVAEALDKGARALVLGGDCTLELGTVAGALRGSDSVGLVYVDLDTDLNTPQSTDDGALDWMGVAHMLGLAGTAPSLRGIGRRAPMLSADQVLFFATDNVTPFERQIIEERDMVEVRLEEVVRNPAAAARRVADGWAQRFERLLVHVDVDVLDFLDFPLAENVRRNRGLRFDQLMAALGPLLSQPNLAALTITEVNPDHGEDDGSTLRHFNEALAETLSAHRP